MFDLKTLQLGDCILFKGKSFVSRGIRWFTDSEWNHTAIYVGGGDNFIIEATEAGVEKNQVSPLLKKASKFCIRRIPNLTVENAELMKTKAYESIYKPYDNFQFVSMIPYFLLRKIGITISWLVRNVPGRLICSELFAVCALTIPIKFKEQTSLVTPDTLAKTELMNTIYEGTL